MQSRIALKVRLMSRSECLNANTLLELTNKVSSDFGQNFTKLWLPVPAHMLAHRVNEPEVGQLWKLGKRC